LYIASVTSVNAGIIAPGSGLQRAWGFGVLAALALLLVLAACGFGLVQWVRPGTYGQLRDAFWNLAIGRLPYYFWLGVRGFIGGLVWLGLPISLMAMASLLPNAGTDGQALLGFLLRVVGSLMLMLVVVHLPFLQAKLAAENRFAAVFELRAVRRQFRRAPLAFGFAATITLLFALPLYLLKIELVPADAAWLPALLFVVFIFPARLLTGWACARSHKRQTPRHWFLRLVARLSLIPIAALYVFIVFLTQFTGWHGVWGMYEQHAFLLPVPFLGL
jgi:hypothetical protein